MPRFVVLEHDYPFRHWDFMLEAGPVLKTWRLECMPGGGDEAIGAEPLGDHRLAYLEYEGALSGDRGRVVRRAQGEYAVDQGSLEGDFVLITLHGDVLQGTASFRREEATWIFGPNKMPYTLTEDAAM